MRYIFRYYTGTMLAVLFAALLALLMYGVGSFVAGGWSLSRDWYGPGRFFVALSWFVISAVVTYHAWCRDWRDAPPPGVDRG